MASETKEGFTAKDLVIELKKASKSQGSLPPGFHDWVMITEPIEIRVTKHKMPRHWNSLRSLLQKCQVLESPSPLKRAKSKE